MRARRRVSSSVPHETRQPLPARLPLEPATVSLVARQRRIAWRCFAYDSFVQQRLESSELGRLTLSVAIVFLLVSLVAVSMPSSRLRDTLLTPGEPVLHATGLDQDWRIFSPDPRVTAIRLEARIEFSDGGVAAWRPPGGGAVLGAYWDYRWRKLTEHVLLDPNAGPLWRRLTDYVARIYIERGRRPARISLIAFERPIPPLGSAMRVVRWRERAFFRATVTSAR